jgi:cysteine desulfurase
MSGVYLDHCATAPLNPAAREAMRAYLDEERFGHASSVHTPGREAEARVSRARIQVSALIDARPMEVVFTGSGTEANNLAIKGAAEQARAEGRGEHLITTVIEHESVAEPFKHLEMQGFRVSRVRVDREGRLDLEAFERALTSDTALVSAMMVNHEVGVTFPVQALAERAHAVGALMHTDAAMAVGRMPVSVRSLGVDLLTLSGHKFGGPQGVGALYVRRGSKLVPQLVGGHHERKRRAGSENVLGVLGMGAAAAAVDLVQTQDVLEELSDALLRGIFERVPGVHLNGDAAAPSGILNLAFEGVEGESLLMNLDLSGIFVSSGAPCSSGSLEPSPVLLAMGLEEKRARSSVRFSLGPTTTRRDVDRVLEVLPGIVQRLRSLKPARRC